MDLIGKQSIGANVKLTNKTPPNQGRTDTLTNIRQVTGTTRFYVEDNYRGITINEGEMHDDTYCTKCNDA